MIEEYTIGKHGPSEYNYLTITCAQRQDGWWVFGIDYCVGASGGGGFHYDLCDKKLGTLRDCQYEACICGLARISSMVPTLMINEKTKDVKAAEKLEMQIMDYMKALKRPKYVQLELF